MAQEQAKIRLAFIAGAGLSGSTLLEQALSQVEGCVSIGELHCLWKPYWPLMVCECGQQFRECEFWQEVLADAYGSEQESIRARVESLGEGFLRHSIVPALAGSKRKGSLGAAFDEIGALLEPVYRAAATRSGASILVDSTKSALWGLGVARSKGIELSTLHLVRDPRGFSFSNGRSRAFFYPPGSMTTPHGAARSLVNWSLANLEAGRLGTRVASNTVVTYDDLTREPAAVIRSITKTLGLDSDTTTVFDGDTLVVDRVGHAIGGNPRRPRRGSTVIKPDEAWKTSASRSLRTLSPLCLPLWHHYQRNARTSLDLDAAQISP